MMSGCPSANAAHARPRGVSDSEGESPPPALTNLRSEPSRCHQTRTAGGEPSPGPDTLEVRQPTHRRRPIVAQRRPRRLELRLQRLAASDRRADLREVVAVLGAQGAHLSACVLLLLRRQPDLPRTTSGKPRVASWLRRALLLCWREAAISDNLGQSRTISASADRGAAEVARGAGEPLLERRVPGARSIRHENNTQSRCGEPLATRTGQPPGYAVLRPRRCRGPRGLRVPPPSPPGSRW